MVELRHKCSLLPPESPARRSFPIFGRVVWLAGCAILMAAAGLMIEPRFAQATECANAGAQTTAPNDNAVVTNTACGNAAVANGDRATAVGSSAQATRFKSTAIGDMSVASGDGATALGTSSSATETNSTALGGGAVASGSQSTAVGVAASAGDLGTAVGSNASAVGLNGTAVGFLTSAVGSNSVAIGSSATAAGVAGTSVGANAQAGGVNSLAIGSGSSAAFSNSTAIGNGAVATRSGQQMFGAATNTYTMAGITSAASAAAQTGTRQVVTSDANGNLATSSLAGLGIASSSDIGLLQSQIDGLVQRDRQLASGIAISMALAQPMLQSGQTVGVRVGWGNFGGSNAVGVSAAGVLARGFAGPTTSLVVDAGVGFSSSQTGGRVGVTLGW